LIELFDPSFGSSTLSGTRQNECSKIDFQCRESE
jgi:hypothetical protein